MKNKNELFINNQTLELCRFEPDRELTQLIGENTLVVLPERMTALEAVNTVAVLTDLTTGLIEILRDACGTCGEQIEKEAVGCCPYDGVCDPKECAYKDMVEPEVELSDSARRAMGIPLDAKLEFFPDEGEGLVCTADYKHDITDVPEEIRPLLELAGICTGKLDELIMNEKEIWHVQPPEGGRISDG